jgi:hypothetical protein
MAAQAMVLLFLPLVFRRVQKVLMEGLYCQATSVGCIPCTTNGITNWVLVCEMEMVRETHPTQMRKSMPDYGTLRHFGNVRF